MKKVQKVYIIGPVTDDSQRQATESTFNWLCQILKNYSASFVGNHYYPDSHIQGKGKLREMRFQQIMQSDLIIQMDGAMKCSESMRDLHIAEWMEKKIIFSEEAMQLTNGKDDGKGILNQVKKWLQGLDKALEPAMTNPMKLKS